MAITPQTPPKTEGHPNPPLFQKERFDAAIWNKGYEVILEQAIACPCRGKTGAARHTCLNCLGNGFVFINPVATRAIISSINKDTKYKNWSPELTGTISVTLMDANRISFFDKITFKSRSSILSEVRQVLPLLEGGYFCFTSYKIKKINHILVFNGDNNKLLKIPETQYTIKDNRNIIDFSETFVLPANGVISIDYEHEVSYNVFDIPHDFRSAFVVNESGKNQEYNLPVQAIAKRTHILMGESYKYIGEKLNNDI